MFSSIPITDSLNRIMFEGQRVLLKMNPVNEYLAPIFERAFQPLIRNHLFRIVTGGVDVGAELVHHDLVNEVHVTGSSATHDAIVWGNDADEQERRKSSNDPRLTKKITSELGNVTPWVVVPGIYRPQELASQAAHIAASITNNDSFNCLATKLILTWADWPQRDEFLRLIQKYLDATPRRLAYYPGAADRFRRFAQDESGADENGCLPYRLLTNQSIDERPELFSEESFVPVCAETALASASPEEFLLAAVEFVNERVFGTLCATVTFPSGFRQRHAKISDDAIDTLRYGSVCINQWSGLGYGLISPPWGAYGGHTAKDIGSGIGSVHNTFLLDRFEKTVLEGPLINFPKPVWFSSHRKSRQVGERLLDLFHRPSPLRLALIIRSCFDRLACRLVT